MTSPFAQTRVEIGATLRTVQALHIGTGLESELTQVEFDAEAAIAAGREHPLADEIMIDGAEAPYIPGSSLKGAMRAMLSAQLRLAGKSSDEASDLADTLFGSVKDAGSGAMSPLIVYGATYVGEDSAHDGRPLRAALRRDRVTGGVSAAARTAINCKTGAAERHRLFHALEVPPGVSFKFEALYLPEFGAPSQQLFALLLALLKTDGLTLGRATRGGQGRVKASEIELKTMVLDATGALGHVSARDADWRELDADRQAVLRKSAKYQDFKFTLKGDGPFFVNDWAWKRPDLPTRDPDMKAQRDNDATPLLPGTSLLGALRARAEWQCAIAKLRNDGVSPFQHAVVASLFGDTERRGLFSVHRIEALADRTQTTMTSVALDRFSGAPIDGALFSTQAFVDPVFAVTLRLDDKATAEHEACLEALVADFLATGPILGHSGARGFGWFEKAREDEDEPQLR